MPKYMIKASYTVEGARGVMKGGGSARRAAVEHMAEALGGRVESFYFAFGGDDAYVTVELPDATTAAAVSLAVNSSGGVQATTVSLLTPEDVDAAAKKSVDYTPPGS